MRVYPAVSSSRGQLKIQEMAFVLVGIFVFFGLVFMFYASVRFSSIKQDAQDVKDLAAKEMVKTLSGSPEFRWDGCENCVDLDKVFLLSEKKKYSKFWNLDYLVVERVEPKYKDVECTRANYPECSRITITNSSFYGTPAWSFVSICSYQPNKDYTKCELGKIYASGRQIQ